MVVTKMGFESDDIVCSIADAISNLENSERVKELVNKALSKGIPAVEIVYRGLRVGLDRVGKKYEAGEFFLSELLYSGMLMSESLEILEPRLKLEKIQNVGTIVIGPVRGDLHDIGKNIVAMLLQGAGFEVVDLGADVSKEKFLEFTQRENPDILGMSALLTTTMVYMSEIIDTVRSAGLKRNVKFIIGGAPVTQSYAEAIKADGYAPDAASAVDLSKRILNR